MQLIMSKSLTLLSVPEHFPWGCRINWFTSSAGLTLTIPSGENCRDKKAIKDTEEAYKIGDKEERQKRLMDINEVFDDNASDYGRKLYLIENCIYGVDIQPIAVQIAKLRFFISLLVDQYINPKKENLGIRPLPNLETKFVVANTLIGIERPAQGLLRNREIDRKEADLKQVRERHFTARTPKTKQKCTEDDKKLRAEISELLKKTAFQQALQRSLQIGILTTRTLRLISLIRSGCLGLQKGLMDYRQSAVYQRIYIQRSI